MTDKTPEQRLFLAWTATQEAEARVGMARQTLQGAERELFDKQSRFMGQLEFVAGGPCSWKVDVSKQEITVELLPEAPKSEPEPAPVETGAAGDGAAGADAQPDASNVVALPGQSG